jgi:hypothetical protein
MLSSGAAGARARARAGLAKEGNEARGFRERHEEVELVRRRARLHSDERGTRQARWNPPVARLSVRRE